MHLGVKKKNNRKSDNFLEFRRIFLLLNYKFLLLCLKIMKSCLSKCCFPTAYELPKSLLISCPKSKKMRRGIAPHFPILYKRAMLSQSCNGFLWSHLGENQQKTEAALAKTKCRVFAHFYVDSWCNVLESSADSSEDFISSTEERTRMGKFMKP